MAVKAPPSIKKEHAVHVQNSYRRLVL